MNKHVNDSRSIDDALEKMLHQVQPVPPRDPGMAARGRARYVAQVARAARRTGPLKESPDMVPRRVKNRLFAIATAALVVVLVLGAAGATAVAASRALPGDTLYPVKTSVEQTRMGLAREGASRAMLNMTFADRRLGEIEGLIAAGRTGEIGAPAAEYERIVQSTLATLDTLAEQDPGAAQILAVQLATSWSDYSLALSRISSEAPEAERTSAQSAVSFTLPTGTGDGEHALTGTVEQIDAGYWIISGQRYEITAASEISGVIILGDRVSFRASVDGDGTFALRTLALPTEPYVASTFTFSGTLTRRDEAVWVVSGHPLQVTVDSVIDSTLETGERVVATVQVDAEGLWTLLAMERDAEDDLDDDDDDDMDDDDGIAGNVYLHQGMALMQTGRFQGTVEAMDDAAWIIGGYRFAITLESVIDESIAVGDRVKVVAQGESTDALVLVGVERKSGPVLNFKFRGTVETMTDTAWTVRGLALTLTPETRIMGDIAVGDTVKIEARADSDGVWYLLDAKPQGGEMDDDGGNDRDTDDDDRGREDTGDDDDDRDREKAKGRSRGESRDKDKDQERDDRDKDIDKDAGRGKD